MRSTSATACFNTFARVLSHLALIACIVVPVPAAANTAPAIWGKPGTVAYQNTLYDFRPGAADSDGNKLIFSIRNKPGWMWFDWRTGRLSGQPSWWQRGRTYSNIVISVSDGVATRSLPAFSIWVNTTSTNTRPVISGWPPLRGTVGKAYYFRPGAWDRDGDALRFTIENKPRWASFSSRTGALYGTPPYGSAGKYWNVVIRAWDAVSFTSLQPFAITVAAPSGTVSHNVTLSWTPPTRNTDNTWLTNLQGYRVLYGTTSRKYSRVLEVRGGAVRSVEIQGLASGTWYFAVRSITYGGVVSDLSGEARAVL